MQLENTPGVSVDEVERYLLAGLDSECFATIQKRPENNVLQQWLIIDQDGRSEDAGIGKSRLLSSPDSKVLAIVDRTANLQIAAAELLSSRFDFGGQSPQAVDVVLVNEFVADDFIKKLTIQMSSSHPEVDVARNGQEISSRHGLVQSQLKQGAEIVVSNDAAAILRRSNM